MLFAEGYARLLLVIHTVAAVALVAAATHLVVWMRGFPRGHFPRLGATRRFGLISAALFVLTFVLGNLIYPVYKVRVRAEYLDQPTALMTDVRSRADSRARAAADHYSLMPAGVDGTGDDAATSVEAPSDAVLLHRAAGVPRRAAKVARWFDVKEHWVSLGMALALGCAVLLWTWNPRKHGSAIAPMVFLMAVGAAMSAWLAAIIGLVTASWRSIGGL